MNITTVAARLLLACTLALAGSTGMASDQWDNELVARHIRTPADLARLNAFTAELSKMDAEHRAEVSKIGAKMRPLETADLFAFSSLVSAPAIATTRASLAQLSVHVIDNVDALHRAAQKAERYMAKAPLHKDVRAMFNATFQESIGIKIKATERQAAALQELYAALENRLDFAESNLGQISLNDAGQLMFANAQIQEQFNTFQQAASRAHKGVLDVLAAKETGK